MKPEALEIIQGVVSLRSLPEVYRRMTAVIDHPHSSAEDIAKVVIEDPGLTARLLGLVNSSFMGFPQKIETVSQAVSVIGTEQLRDLALATSVMRLFDDLPSKLVDMDSFWRHSLGTAVLARLLAARRHEGNVERFFVAGLLHDVGSLVLYVQCPNQIRRCLRLCERTKTLLHEAEQRVLGLDHTDVGRALLENWKLPLSHQDAVGSHHRPSQAFCFPSEAAVVHVADLVASALEFGSSGERFVPPLDPDALERVGLAASDLSEIVAEAEQQLDEATRIMLWRQA